AVFLLWFLFRLPLPLTILIPYPTLFRSFHPKFLSLCASLRERNLAGTRHSPILPSFARHSFPQNEGRKKPASNLLPFPPLVWGWGQGPGDGGIAAKCPPPRSRAARAAPPP